MTRVAAVDIGTNAVLLLIADGDARGIRAVMDRATITRLGEGVDRTHELSGAAIERTLRCLADYAAAIARSGVTHLAVVGTSALRDAKGAGAFLDAAERTLGARPRIIPGDEEARLTFHGALSGLALEGALTVFDVGGGSTEVIAGDARSGIRWGRSLDVGSVRLFERHVASDPPAAEELAQVRADVRRALDSLPDSASTGATLVGVAGTVTTLAAINAQMGTYDPARVHGLRLSHSDVVRLLDQLSRAPLLARRGIPGLEPGRADVIGVGALIVDEVMRRARVDELVVSDRGVRWGLATEVVGLNS